MLIFMIKQIRENKKISLRNLSKITNISRAYLYDLENNRRFNPTLEMLFKISNALEVNIKDLFYTELDIDELKEELNNRIDVYGISSKEVMQVSQIIDLLINIKFKKEP